MCDEFTKGVLFSAAYIIAAHGDTVYARDLLHAAGVSPTPEMRMCAEVDLAILREHLPEWRKVPRGV